MKMKTTLRFHLTLVKMVNIKKTATNQVLVAHTCNPSYSGGRDQEDHSLKPARANSSHDSILKIPHAKKGWQSICLV
jgi:hypothetical protein